MKERLTNFIPNDVPLNRHRKLNESVSLINESANDEWIDRLIDTINAYPAGKLGYGEAKHRCCAIIGEVLDEVGGDRVLEPNGKKSNAAMAKDLRKFFGYDEAFNKRSQRKGRVCEANTRKPWNEPDFGQKNALEYFSDEDNVEAIDFDVYFYKKYRDEDEGDSYAVRNDGTVVVECRRGGPDTEFDLHEHSDWTLEELRDEIHKAYMGAPVQRKKTAVTKSNNPIAQKLVTDVIDDYGILGDEFDEFYEELYPNDPGYYEWDGMIYAYNDDGDEFYWQSEGHPDWTCQKLADFIHRKRNS